MKNTETKSNKKKVILIGTAITLISLFIGAATQEGDKVDDIYYLGFIIGLFVIIVGCCLKSQKKIDRELQEQAKYADVKFDITNNIDNYLYLDENRRLICIPTGIVNKKIDLSKVFNYSDILNYELLEDGSFISKGGVGRAIVGGALFGDIGAVVGGSTGHKLKQTCTKLQVKITFNNINHPVEFINFIITKVRKDNIVYKNAYNSAQKVLSTLDIICNPNDENRNKNDAVINNKSVPEQIKEYKELLDNGSITQEEFDKKKKELLNL